MLNISPIFVPSRGQPDSSIWVVGEAPGVNEEIYRKPFVGASGKLLEEILTLCDIDPTTVFFTNVFPHRPANNNIDQYFTSKKEGVSTLPPLRPGKYLHPEAQTLFDQFISEISTSSPKVILALGNTALWALTRKSGITKYRGVSFNHLLSKVIPTFHPSAILRNYSLRSIVEADISKAKQLLTVHQNSPSPQYNLHLNPTLADLDHFLTLAKSADYIAVDIETANRQIRTVGFSTSPFEAFVIPFFNQNINYWPTAEEEICAWRTVKNILALPQPKIFHNGVYDIQYLWSVMGIPVTNFLHDTMLLHHSLQPEMQKSLGFLGSIYTDNFAWKEMRDDLDTEDEDKEE